MTMRIYCQKFYDGLTCKLKDIKPNDESTYEKVMTYHGLGEIISYDSNTHDVQVKLHSREEVLKLPLHYIVMLSKYFLIPGQKVRIYDKPNFNIMNDPYTLGYSVDFVFDKRLESYGIDRTTLVEILCQNNKICKIGYDRILPYHLDFGEKLKPPVIYTAIGKDFLTTDGIGGLIDYKYELGLGIAYIKLYDEDLVVIKPNIDYINQVTQISPG